MDGHVFVDKMVLSSRPSETSDVVLMIIAGDDGHLGFSRLGYKEWKRTDLKEGRYRDVVYNGGRFYAFCNQMAWVFNLAAAEKGKDIHIERRLVTHFIPKDMPTPTCYPIRSGNPLIDNKGVYLLKLVDESLLIITRTISRNLCPDETETYTTTEFQVYEVDIATGTWEEIYSLGSMAVFLGHNSTTGVDTSTFSGGLIKANHIYFCDDDWGHYYYDSPDGGGMDSGIFNFETGTIEPLYPGEVLLNKVSPSTWITPCF